VVFYFVSPLGEKNMILTVFRKKRDKNCRALQPLIWEAIFNPGS